MLIICKEVAMRLVDRCASSILYADALVSRTMTLTIRMATKQKKVKAGGTGGTPSGGSPPPPGGMAMATAKKAARKRYVGLDSVAVTTTYFPESTPI